MAKFITSHVMIKKGLLTIFLLLSLSGFSKGLLDIVISVDIKDTPIKKILEVIEKKANVSFTYDPGIIDDKKVISVTIHEKTIREGLVMILGENIRFKEVGRHIVLLKVESKEVIKERKKEVQEYIFVGEVTDALTGKPIEGASVYDMEDRYATITDRFGFYALTVPATYELRGFYIKKKGYKGKAIILKGDPNEKALNDVALEPEAEDITLISSTNVEKLDPNINDKAISGALVSKETQVHGENLVEIDETRWAQISLVPSVSIGSNLSTNALINNHFSFNVLGGFSKGVRGCEIGGLFNINKEHMYGAQIGGIANLVGGDIVGVQVGGISNLLQGNATGLQIGGITTIMKKDLLGAQISGVASVVRGGFTGLQLSGVGNFAWRKSRGAQISGVFNLVRDSLVGGQISGVSNFSNGGVNFLQIAGVSNFAGKNNGLQIAGIQNFSKENNGLQIGLINSSIKGNGVSIGLFNWVKEGYHKTEVAANEIFPVNLTLKTGTQRLYNVYNFGVRFGSRRAYAFGLGFGTYFNLTDNEKLKLSIDLTDQVVFENDFQSFEFAQLIKLSTTFDWQIAKWVSMFAGPSFNINLVQFQDNDGQYSTDISFLPIADNSYSWGRSLMWVGGQIGFRF